MVRSAIIILCVSYCAFLFGQNVSLSRDFEAFRKNVPIAIINNHPHYFHVLRYNKDVHDLTIERRAKPSAEIVAFTPLKLDSVNADWFNYENLDYVFYEYNHKIYFLFEKALNNKREIYLKVIDSTGKSSGFNQLATLTKDKTMADFRFELKITAQNKILIVGVQEYIVGTTKKVALLFDPQKQEKIWVKKLAFENNETGYSYGFECNQNGDLFYTMLQSHIAGYKRRYEDHRQVEVPIFTHELLALAVYSKNGEAPVRMEFSKTRISRLYSMSICPRDQKISLFLHFSGFNQAGQEKVYFSTQAWSEDLKTSLYSNTQALDERIENQLTFYDGGDYNSAADKDYSITEGVVQDSIYYVLSERKEPNYYKEMLLVKINLNNGELLDQELIPRKIFYYKDRTRFKNLGEGIRVLCKDEYKVFLLENIRNLSKEPGEFRYNKFKRAGGAASVNLVCYTLTSEGSLRKKAVEINKRFSIIPIRSQSADKCGLVLYLNNDAYEKFAILKLNP